MILDAITPKQPRLLVADLDGTLLHDAEVFEDRFITQRSIDTINRAHDAGMQFAIATARPVSTGLQFAEKTAGGRRNLSERRPHRFRPGPLRLRPARLRCHAGR